MKMTIEESISILKNKGKYSLTEKENEAKGIAIDTMRKYQKIKEYISIPTRYGTMAEDCQKLEYVRKVIEDGNDD